jgi:hypothetical protein
MSNCIIKCQPSKTSTGECICHNQEASRVKSIFKEFINSGAKLEIKLDGFVFYIVNDELIEYNVLFNGLYSKIMNSIMDSYFIIDGNLIKSLHFDAIQEAIEQRKEEIITKDFNEMFIYYA